ncbi:MAG: hypothetical protein OXK76_07630 [Gammaproteobacteria bacterium]|nr:hypothetical protein [Gammaproteobacteria bacterium]
MNLLSPDFLDQFSPEHYVAILADIAYADGIDPEEQAILERYASQFGVDLNALPTVPNDLSEVSWSTRVLIYRDAFMLALADGTSSQIEEDRLAELATKMRLPDLTTEELRGWVLDYGALLERFHDLLEAEPES